jgi:IS30 family transposase
MKSYTHLTEPERYHIHMMNKQNYTLTEIASTMDRNKSTIGREIKRTVIVINKPTTLPKRGMRRKTNASN